MPSSFDFGVAIAIFVAIVVLFFAAETQRVRPRSALQWLLLLFFPATKVSTHRKVGPSWCKADPVRHRTSVAAHLLFATLACALVHHKTYGSTSDAALRGSSILGRRSTVGAAAVARGRDVAPVILFLQ